MRRRREQLAALRARVAAVAAQVGHPLRLLVGKPGLDGHSNGAEQVAVRAKDAGFEVIYEGIRLTPEQIVASALRRGRRRRRPVDPLRLAHDADAAHHSSCCASAASATCRSSSAASSPRPIAASLQAPGVARIYTPGEATLTEIIGDIVELIAAAHGRAA